MWSPSSNGLGTTIDVPDEILAGDANALRRIARLMEGIVSSWTDASFVLDPGGPKEIETEGVFQLRQQMGAELFGREYQLGELATYIDGYHLDSSRTDSDGSTEYVLMPRDSSSKMLERLEPRRSSTGSP
jgi:hypothetical protein